MIAILLFIYVVVAFSVYSSLPIYQTTIYHTHICQFSVLAIYEREPQQRSFIYTLNLLSLFCFDRVSAASIHNPVQWAFTLFLSSSPCTTSVPVSEKYASDATSRWTRLWRFKQQLSRVLRPQMLERVNGIWTADKVRNRLSRTFEIIGKWSIALGLAAYLVALDLHERLDRDDPDDVDFFYRSKRSCSSKSSRK